LSDAGTISACAEFRLAVRVYIEDTDAGGIVYYVNYLKYFERARTELLRSAGFAKAALLDGEAMFVVHEMQVTYLKSAILDDELDVDARIVEGGRARLVFEQGIWRGAEAICRARISVACVNPTTRKPQALPARVRELFALSPNPSPASGRGE
jgi:4-hydroxybenzoyl-CoA thioesterase